MAKFIFTARLEGSGNTQHAAWLNAIEKFTNNPPAPATVSNTLGDVVALLDKMSIGRALWWFTENIDSDDENRNALFQYLRERVRTTKKL